MDRRPNVVLVAEDEWLTRVCVCEALVDAGFQVIEAEHGDVAWKIFQLHTTDIDALFTDIRMPGEIDGLELARRARALLPKLAIVIASGNLVPSSSVVPLGTRFLRKPYGFQDIVPSVQALFDATPAPP